MAIVSSAQSGEPDDESSSFSSILRRIVVGWLARKEATLDGYSRPSSVRFSPTLVARARLAHGGRPVAKPAKPGVPADPEGDERPTPIMSSVTGLKSCHMLEEIRKLDRRHERSKLPLGEERQAQARRCRKRLRERSKGAAPAGCIPAPGRRRESSGRRSPVPRASRTCRIPAHRRSIAPTRPSRLLIRCRGMRHAPMRDPTSCVRLARS